MTNQEAIALLKIERDHMTPTIFTERVEAMDMAISALQAQEAKTQLSAEGTTSDLIGRQDAIDAINEICERCGEGKKYNGVMCGACNLDGVADIVEDLPSAQPERCEDCENFSKTRLLIPQPERKKGWWLPVHTGTYDSQQKIEWRCSECGAGMYRFYQKFCHECGAKMEGMEKSDD